MIVSLQQKRDEPVIQPEEILHGFGFQAYPVELLELADLIFEASGRIPTQDEVLAYDPRFLSDLAKYRRLKAVIEKANNGNEH